MKPLQLFQKPMLLVLLLLISTFCFSQVTEQWIRRYNGHANNADIAASLAADASGNVYVTGNSYDSNHIYSDYVTVKYDAAGNELWVKIYNGPGNEYDESYDFATSLAVDDSGNVYVTGSSVRYGTSFDYATIKYDANGNELWVKRYNGPGHGYDQAAKIVVDALGNVYVTGTSNQDYATIKYDAAGNELWVKRYNGPENYGDSPSALAVDAFGNVYVTGGSIRVQDDSETGDDVDYATIKYDAAGNELWVRRYNGTEYGAGGATSLAIDASGNVYVTGGIADTGHYSQNYATIKYDADGNELWIKKYSGPRNTDDLATSLAIDAYGNVYVTGASLGNDSFYDYATVKYDADGNELWIKRYNGPGNGYDGAVKLVIDASGNVYVTGYSEGGDSYYDYATIKYDASGNELWVKRYNGPGNSYDGASSLAIDASGNVYVTGDSYSNETGADYSTIKYSQTQISVVSSFTLINADSDEPIRELKDSDTINLKDLSSVNLNIRANTDPGTIGSVGFRLSGAEVRNHTENIVPYALFADNNNGDYYSWTPTNGNYTLTATPYSSSKGGGEKGKPLTIHFTVTGMVVSNFILVNAETDQDIKTLQNGDVLDLSTLPTDKLNIRAVVHPDTVGSVVFNMNNRLIVRENLAPYAIGGDIKGDYRAWTLPTGHHNLTATPYEGKYDRSKKGKAYSVAFTVVDGLAITHTANPEKPITEAQNTGQNLKATPNPFSGQTTINFVIPQSGYTTLQVCDVKGTVVAYLYEAQAEAGKTYSVSFDSKQLASGIYVLKLVSGKQVQSYKLILVR